MIILAGAGRNNVCVCLRQVGVWLFPEGKMLVSLGKKAFETIFSSEKPLFCLWKAIENKKIAKTALFVHNFLTN